MAHSPIEFVFTPEERRLAIEEGLRRQAVNEAQGLRGRNKGPRFGDKALQVHLLGAAGEMAVASYLGMKEHLYREKEARRGSDDLPGGIDVKTRSKSCYDLIVQKGSDARKKYVLVTIDNQRTLLHGWCYGEEAMQEQFWADPARGRPAYFFPSLMLRPMESLK
jgi:hypothetical protein